MLTDIKNISGLTIKQFIKLIFVGSIWKVPKGLHSQKQKCQNKLICQLHMSTDIRKTTTPLLKSFKNLTFGGHLGFFREVGPRTMSKYLFFEHLLIPKKLAL